LFIGIYLINVQGIMINQYKRVSTTTSGVRFLVQLLVVFPYRIDSSASALLQYKIAHLLRSFSMYAVLHHSLAAILHLHRLQIMLLKYATHILNIYIYTQLNKVISHGVKRFRLNDIWLVG
jgi:hypothetical protein